MAPIRRGPEIGGAEGAEQSACHLTSGSRFLAFPPTDVHLKVDATLFSSIPTLSQAHETMANRENSETVFSGVDKRSAELPRSRRGIREGGGPLKQRDGLGADGHALADSVHAFAGLGFDADLFQFDSQGCGELFPHGGNVGGELGALKFDRGVNVGDRISGPGKELPSLTEKQQARGVAPAGGRVGKVAADITQRRGAQQRVADGVREGIAVRVPHRTFVEGNPHAAQNQPASRGKAVDVAASSDSIAWGESGR